MSLGTVLAFNAQTAPKRMKSADISLIARGLGIVDLQGFSADLAKSLSA